MTAKLDPRQGVSPRVTAVLFGGRSLEHDVSIVSGLQVLHALDPERCQGMPVYIDQQLRWWIGDDLWHTDAFKRGGPDRARLTEVQLAPGFGTSTLIPVAGAGALTRPSVAVDVFLPILHGTFGEDGSIQGLLEVAGCAYVGCGVTASAVGMNKRVTKMLAAAVGVPIVPWTACPRQVLERGSGWMRELAGQVERDLGWPVIVKPCNLGSSAGVSTARSAEELTAGVLKVFEYDVEALIEPFIQNRLELNVAVVGLDEPVASVSEMPATSRESILSFSEKYRRQGGKSVGTSQGMAGALRVLDPQDLPLDVRQRAQQYAATVFRTLGCEGISRIDFLIDGDSGALYFNEINTLPGSLAFYLWSAAPHFWTITDLLNRLIARAERLRAMKHGLQRQPPPDLQLFG